MECSKQKGIPLIVSLVSFKLGVQRGVGGGGQRREEDPKEAEGTICLFWEISPSLQLVTL